MPPRRPAPRFHLHLLGGATLLADDGSPIAGPAAQRHRLALLALLARAHPLGLRRDKLIGLLWPEREEPAARHLLRAAIHELRRTVGPAALATSGDELRLDPISVRVDVHAFEAAIDAGHPDEAVAHYRGPFLDGLFLDDAEAFTEWASAERARLARRHEDALERLATEAGQSDDGGAIPWWRALSAIRPGDGRVARSLVDALVAAGDVGGALAHVAAHGAHLAAEHGVAPDPVLLRRAEAIRAPAPPAEPPPTVSPPVVASPDALPDIAMPDAAPSVPLSRPRRRVARLALRLAVIALVLAGAVAAVRWRPMSDAGPRRAGASAGPEVIAVAPFTVVGGGAHELGEGFVELLTATLDQVPELRVLPAPVAFSRAAALAAAGDAAGDVAPSGLASALGVDVVLTGVVAALPAGRLEVRAALLAADGAERARATARGSADDLPALVDQIVVDVLRELLGQRLRVPAPRLAAVTTTSSDALRAFLRGEAFLRAALWDSAATALAEAVDLDSTFALAYLRLAEPYGWRYGMASPPAARALAAAQRFAARLPPRERALLTVRLLHERGDLAALDNAAALAERYPDDPEAQYVRADVRFHARFLRGEQHARLAAASFDTAAVFDSTAARVFAHPVTLALERGDSARFDRAVARLVSLGAGSHVQVAARPDYALLRAVRWSAPRSAYRTLVARLRSRTPPPAWQASDLLDAIEHACLGAPVPEPDLLLDAYAVLAATYPGDAHVHDSVVARRLRLLAGLGRLSTTSPDAERVWQSDRDGAAVLTLVPAALGYGGRWAAGQAGRLTWASRWDSVPTQRRRSEYWTALFAFAAGDVASGRAALRLAAAATASGDPPPRALASALRGAEGWARLIEGDTTAALRLLEEGIAQAGYDGDGLVLNRPLRALHLRLLARRPERRAEAADRLRAELAHDEGIAWVWWRRELALVLGADGDAAGAAAERARFEALWAGADADVRAAGFVERDVARPVAGAVR